VARVRSSIGLVGLGEEALLGPGAFLFEGYLEPWLRVKDPVAALVSISAFVVRK
jgi:hypothetical protein